MKKLIFLTLIAGFILFCSTESYAQTDTNDDVRLFQSFFRDAPITPIPYGELILNYSTFEFLNTLSIGAQGGFAITPEFELGTGLYFLNLDPDFGDGESGVADIPVYGRYNFLNEETKVSGGAFITLPVGSEEIGGGNLNFGVFGALRHPISDYVVLAGNLGIDLIEFADDYEASLSLGGGIIYAATEELSVLGELALNSERENAALSGGVDYVIEGTGRVRGALLIGLDDGAPDLGLTGGFLFTF